MQDQFRPAVCQWCKYEWLTRSKAQFVTCPNCQHKTKIETREVKQTPDVLPTQEQQKEVTENGRNDTTGTST